VDLHGIHSLILSGSHQEGVVSVGIHRDVLNLLPQSGPSGLIAIDRQGHALHALRWRPVGRAEGPAEPDQLGNCGGGLRLLGVSDSCPKQAEQRGSGLTTAA
jgi:hypothetical protein